MRSNTNVIRRHKIRCGHDVRLTRNLASAVATAMNLAPGRHLVLAIGAGDETSNGEALETWVSHQLVQLRGLTHQQLLAELMRRLERKLIDLQEFGHE